MEPQIEGKLDNLEKQCEMCKEKKRCMLKYASVTKRYPDVLKDLYKYLDKQGNCKGYHGKDEQGKR